jgi:hypothetical protein
MDHTLRHPVGFICITATGEHDVPLDRILSVQVLAWMSDLPFQPGITAFRQR